MKNDKNKKKQESFPDVNTPTPPQKMDPSQLLDDKGNIPSAEKKENNNQHMKSPNKDASENKSDKKPKLLGESEIEIDDETTI